MRPVKNPKTKAQRRRRRHVRIRRKLRGTADRPRLVVFRSAKHVYAQIIDDDKGHTLLGVSDQAKDVKSEKNGKIAASFTVGKVLAERAVAAGMKAVVFDRGGYPYHGRVKALADGARKGGLEF